MRLITPKMARKSPNTLTNCASQSVRNPGWENSALAEAGRGVSDMRSFSTRQDRASMDSIQSRAALDQQTFSLDTRSGLRRIRDGRFAPKVVGDAADCG